MIQVRGSEFKVENGTLDKDIILYILPISYNGWVDFACFKAYHLNLPISYNGWVDFACFKAYHLTKTSVIFPGTRG
jgi:hypothetical protein